MQELEWTMQDLYDLLLLLASFVPPARGCHRTWIVLAYGVFLAVAVTTFSIRVLGLHWAHPPGVLLLTDRGQ